MDKLELGKLLVLGIIGGSAEIVSRCIPQDRAIANKDVLDDSIKIRHRAALQHTSCRSQIRGQLDVRFGSLTACRSPVSPLAAIECKADVRPQFSPTKI